MYAQDPVHGDCEECIGLLMTCWKYCYKTSTEIKVHIMSWKFSSNIAITTVILVSVLEPVISSTTTIPSSRPQDFDPTFRSKLVNLSIAGFYSQSSSWDSTGVIPAVELAVDHVNNRKDILEGYQLNVVWKNSKCQVSDGIWAFHRQLVEKPQKMMLLGAACSTVTQPVAETAFNGNLVTISYASTSPILSNRERFRYFFRTRLSETLLNIPKIWLMERFNWTRVGTLTQNHEWFISTNNHMLRNTAEENIEVEISEIIDNKPTVRQLNKLKEADLRIFVVFSYEDTATELFCEIYKAKLYGKGYVWMIPGWYTYQWWTATANKTACTDEEIETAVLESRYISVEQSNFTTTPEAAIVSGHKAEDFINQFENKRKEVETLGYDIAPSGIEPFGYDALWAIALTLNRSVETLVKEGRRLENFTYDDNITGKVMFSEMNSTKFMGLTGNISFLHGDRQSGPVRIEQLQESCRKGWKLSHFNCYKMITEKMTWEAAREHCKKLQEDRQSSLVFILNEKEFDFLSKNISGEWLIGLTYNKTSEKLMWVDTNDKELQWRPKSFTKSNSECFVWDASTGHWKPIDCENSRPFICKTRPDADEVPIYTLSPGEDDPKPIKHADFIWYDDYPPLDRTPAVEMGLTPLAYGITCALAVLGIIMAIGFLVFNITARKHKFVKLSSPRFNNLIIFGGILIYLSVCILGMDLSDQDGKRKTVRAFCMLRVWLMSVGFVLGFGALFSKTWRVYKVANIRKVKRVKIKDSQLFLMVGFFLLIDLIILLVWQLSDPLRQRRIDIDTSHYIYVCDCEYFDVWFVVLLVYKGIIILFGSFLSWQTRKVTIPALNDSKLIGICVYNTTVLCVVGLCVSLVSPHEIVFQYLLSSAIMIYCATVTLVIIFVPKVLFVWINPDPDSKTISSVVSSAQLKSSQDSHLASATASTDIKGASSDQLSNPQYQSNIQEEQKSKTLTRCLKELTGFNNKEIYVET